MQQLIQEDSQRPDVQRIVVLLVLEHFGGHLVERSAEGCAAPRELRAPAEVAELDVFCLCPGAGFPALSHGG